MCSFFRNFVEQHFAIFLHVVFSLPEGQPGDVVQGLEVVPAVLQLDVEVEVVAAVLLRQVQGLAEVARLPAHPDGRLHVKIDSTPFRHDELRKLVVLVQPDVAVEEQGGVVLRGCALPVQLLQVLRQVVDALCVQELANDVRGLQLANCLYVHLHSTLVVSFAVQVVSVLAKDVDQTVFVVLLTFGQADCERILVLLE
uniref:Uncharacterized protein n=1 Tax=Ixodes ricinus TaxID=34613 RepID=A0A6B0V0T7_IXORI